MVTPQQYADAMRAFEAYYDKRKELFGASWPSKKYAEHRSWPVFLKVADICAEGKRDINRFIECVLTHMTKNGDTVLPRDLLSKAAEEAWKKYGAVRRVNAADKWAYYARLTMQMSAANEQSDEAILGTAFNAMFPAWFRVLYPEHLSDKILERWGTAAIQELQAERDIVRFIRAAMPAKMEAFEKKMGVLNGLYS